MKDLTPYQKELRQKAHGEIRRRFVNLIQEIDRLYETYGHTDVDRPDYPIIDTKIILEAYDKSEFLQDLMRLNDEGDTLAVKEV